jgi:hypothetical protein
VAGACNTRDTCYTGDVSCTHSWERNLDEKECSVDEDVDKIRLKWILNNWIGSLWTEFAFFRIRTSGCLFWSQASFGSIKCWEFLEHVRLLSTDWTEFSGMCFNVQRDSKLLSGFPVAYNFRNGKNKTN